MNIKMNTYQYKCSSCPNKICSGCFTGLIPECKKRCGLLKIELKSYDEDTILKCKKCPKNLEGII